jgi:hypothetical protein
MPNLKGIRPLGVQLFHAARWTEGQTDGRTDKQTDTKLIVAFRNFASALHNCIWFTVLVVSTNRDKPP